MTETASPGRLADADSSLDVDNRPPAAPLEPATPPRRDEDPEAADDDSLSDLPDLPDISFDEAFGEPLANGVNGHTSPQPSSEAALGPDSEPISEPIEPASDDVPEHATENGVGNGAAAEPERPAKRRRVHEEAPAPAPGSASRPKPESPPWKKIQAEGPTSFTENGRRKSGRINTVPLELQPQGSKRLTRRALHGLQGSSPPAKTRQVPNGRSAPGQTGRKMPPPPPPAKTQTKAPPKAAQKKAVQEARPLRSRRRTPSPPPQPTRHSTRTRRPTRSAADDEGDSSPLQAFRDSTTDSSGRTPRIKFRVRATTIPLIHFEQVKGKQKLGPSFEEYWQRAGEIPVEEGGLFAAEDGPPYTEEMAKKDAETIMRIEAAVEPGGILSEGRSSVFVPEPAEHPPRQWAHADHMVKAVANFRRLLLAEQQRHRAAAKRIAEACRDEWLRRQPKTAEQIEAEQRERWILRYRVVARALFGTWENIKAEINRRRLEEWEAEEQRRVKAALNEAVNLSEQKLQARRAHLDSEEDGEDEDEDRKSVV